MAKDNNVTVDDENQTMSKQEQKALKKQEKKDIKANKEGGSKGKLLKFVLFFLIILGAIYAFLYFDIFKVRSTYLNDTIQNTPVLKSMFPPAKTEDVTSKADLVQQINDLQSQVDTLTKDNESLNERNTLYVEQIDQLTPLVEEQTAFKEQKAQFDQMIAQNDPQAYKSFYETMYPENAKEEYAKIVGGEEANKELVDYVARFSAMDESNAASILEILSTTDLNLVVKILDNMSADKSGAILASMTPDGAATVAKRMAPKE